MPYVIEDPGFDFTVVATGVHVTHQPEFSKVLDAAGRPLRYERPPVGFDLRSAAQRRDRGAP